MKNKVNNQDKFCKSCGRSLFGETQKEHDKKHFKGFTKLQSKATQEAFGSEVKDQDND